MENSNASRFSPEGEWKAARQDDLTRDVLDAVEAWFRRSPQSPASRIAIPRDLLDSPVEFTPFEFTATPVVKLVREDEGDGLVDFLGEGQASSGVTLSFLATLRPEGDGRYVLWSPVSLVP